MRVSRDRMEKVLELGLYKRTGTWRSNVQGIQGRVYSEVGNALWGEK